jgi:hypothetical protein
MNKTEIEKKYKIELDLIKKYIRNDYIYSVIFNYGMIINNEKITLRSNINVFEMVFLGKLIEITKAQNILEIGCAYGTSGMVIINQINMNGGGSLISIDPFQSTQWNSVGKYNVNKIVEEYNNKNIISTHTIIENYSNDVLAKYIKNGKYLVQTTSMNLKNIIVWKIFF